MHCRIVAIKACSGHAVSMSHADGRMRIIVLFDDAFGPEVGRRMSGKSHVRICAGGAR